MIELLILLLPVAAASGWYVAMRSNKHRSSMQSGSLSAHYFKGLNYLLNEQPDKAIEVFIEMLEVDSETVETHLALGNLFRRRGEVDRAIRIHQNIIARPTLSRGQRALALYELGQDYMRAGLLDRAENLFLELLEIGEYSNQALKQLIEIYEQERDWENAIEIARKIEFATGNSRNTDIAHYHCELADKALRKNDIASAESQVKKSLSVDSNCVRASILSGKIAAKNNDYQSAINAYKQVEKQDPDFISEVIELVNDCTQDDRQKTAFMQYLQHVTDNYGGITPMLMLAALTREQNGEQEAEAFIVEQLRKRPSVRGLGKLIEYHMSHTQGAARDNLLILKSLITDLLDDRPVYKCNVCGFEGKVMHWHCPTCKRWSTVRPIQGVVGE